MATIITNYTTYDQAYYYADLKRPPRLSEEDRRSLMTSSATADNPDLTAQIKQQLIESYLPLAKYYALDLCPKSRYHRDLPDLIGEANLTVVEVITRSDLTQVDDLTSYLVAWIRGRLKGATLNDGLIKVNYGVRTRVRERGEATRFEALDHLLSLDEQMAWFETDDLEEPRATPVTPTEAAPERDPALRAQVETWLSYLSPRSQAVLRLRYGISDDNERQHTTKEIVRLLRLDRRAVLTIERDALMRLRALAEGKATLVQRNGQPWISYPAVYNRHRITPQQEAAMTAACNDLHAQGLIVTGRLLAQATGVSQSRAQQFLRLHREQFPRPDSTSPHGLNQTAAARHQQRLAHVAAVYAEHVAQGERITSSKALARAAHVRIETALEFLRIERGKSE